MVTNEQYERFEPEHERSQYSDGDEPPVVNVSWKDAKAYCAWLSEKAGRLIRLPSEAEWECACRAGSYGEFTFGDDEEELSEYAWYFEECESGARAVATKHPNRWGLSDLHGNVWEWCEDAYLPTYKGAPTNGSPWTEGSDSWRGSPPRVIRGGGWNCPAGECRSARRGSPLPTDRNADRSAIRDGDIGFRPAIAPVD